MLPSRETRHEIVKCDHLQFRTYIFWPYDSGKLLGRWGVTECVFSTGHIQEDNTRTCWIQKIIGQFVRRNQSWEIPKLCRIIALEKSAASPSCPRKIIQRNSVSNILIKTKYIAKCYAEFDCHIHGWNLSVNLRWQEHNYFSMLTVLRLEVLKYIEWSHGRDVF